MDVKEQKEKLQGIYDDLYKLSEDIDSNRNWQALGRLSNIQNRLESIIDTLVV